MDGRRWILASFPAAIAGIGIAGYWAAILSDGVPEIWQAELLAQAGFDWRQTGSVAALIRGASLWLPLFVSSLLVSRFWAELFSRLRRRAVDPGWAVSAWLFSLMLPATMPLPYALIGISFGVVFGSHVFGGTGRYIVSPALLAMVFLEVAYPSLLESVRWIPGVDGASTWGMVNQESVAAAAAAGVSFSALLIGREIGAIGTVSALACYAGALYLMAVYEAARPTVAAAVGAASIAAFAAGGLPWHWHVVIGQFAFLAAFVATDPTIQARTRSGRLAYGATFGVLTIAIRALDPSRPEGSWHALLLAMLCVPMFDHLAQLKRSSRAAEGSQS